MIRILKNSAYKYGYLFITAAWLYTVSFLFTNYFSYDSSPEKVSKVLAAYINNQDKQFNNFVEDSAWLKAVTSNKPLTVKPKTGNDNTDIFIYSVNSTSRPRQLYWSSNTITVNNEDIDKPDGNYAVAHTNGFFVLMKRTVEETNKKYILIGMVPVYWAYFIEYEDVQRRFAVYPRLESNYTISLNNIGTPIITNDGKKLFYVEKKENTSLDQPGTASILFRVAAIILLMIFFNSIATELCIQNGFLSGFLFLTMIVVPVRAATYFFPFPFDFRSLYLFYPGVYASSALHPSLGDLMINAILLYWLVSFIKFNIHLLKNVDKILTKKAKKVIGVASLFVIPLFTIWIALFLSSLVKDSASDKISFDVTNFFSMNIYTIVSFISICFLLLSFFYLSQLLVRLSLFTRLSLYWRIIILLSFTLLFFSVKIFGATDTTLSFALLAWLILFYVFIDLRIQDSSLSFYNSPYFMPWSIFLMASISAFLIYQNKTLELEKRISIAEKINSESDTYNEKILSVTLSRFSQFFTEDNFRRFYAPNENKLLKDDIINNNFVGYLNHFTTRIYTYSYDDRPLYNQDSISYDIIKSIIINQGRITYIQDLYYYENAADRFSYIYEKAVYSRDSALLGSVFLIIKPKAYKDEELTPMLFRQLVKDQPLIGKDYAYAIYEKYNLVKSSSNYNFADTIYKKDIPKFEPYYKDKNDYSELWYNGGNNKVIVIARKSKWFSESVTFFAYLFGLLIILVLVQHFGNLILKTHFRWDEIKRVFRFNIRTQIQAIIVAVTIISFIVIGIATISFFISRFNKDSDEKIRNTARIITNEIEQVAQRNDIKGDIFSPARLDMNPDMEKRIIEIAETHNTDINFFDLDGNLELSSQQYVYDNQILSRKMNPNAYNAMHYNRNTQYIQEENVVDFSYQSVYVPIKNEDGLTVNYLNLPFISTQNEVNQEISNFLITLINLNALIFILAGGIALWVTKRITSSFTIIGNKMKAISFGTENEEIVWKKDDELGELVNEYNKMVKKLAESARALARSEREGAWREMARQVAHEIKNPLTPMKLSVQYLERAIENNSSNVKDLSKLVARTLVEQIDQLSKIAGDFSQFANIAYVKNEIFDLSDVLSNIIQLFSSDERINIIWKREQYPCVIEADKIQINRLFTNLIKNAIEAYPDDVKAKIILRQIKNQHDVIVSIQDKGHGIPVNMQPKIFAPNFTTKTSGTGLGLAICKGIVEKANGAIWFETRENEGTIFFVSLPLA